MSKINKILITAGAKVSDKIVESHELDNSIDLLQNQYMEDIKNLSDDNIFINGTKFVSGESYWIRYIDYNIKKVSVIEASIY